VTELETNIRLRRGIYVASTFTHGPTVQHIHDLIIAAGAKPLSTWAEKARGQKENLRAMTTLEKVIAMQENYRQLAKAEVVIVYDPNYDGHETYLEVARAIDAGKPIVWIGKRWPLSVDVYSHTIHAETIEIAVSEALNIQRVPLQSYLTD
jgi:hypothetical protein